MILNQATVGLGRKAMVDFTFSDGTLVRKGELVAAPAHALHRDEAFYENPLEFDGFRFANIREEDGEGAKHQMVATSSAYLPFGHGQHAWWVAYLMSKLVTNTIIKPRTLLRRSGDEDCDGLYPVALRLQDRWARYCSPLL